MDKSMKLYGKAINYYNEGYLDKALDYCEKSISENLKNTSAINLKGLLYYLKGELENAQGLWKMNTQVNKDAVSKKYLEDSRNDENRKLLYLAALKEIKELRIREALQMLIKCKDSDFNSININNYIALCYIKLGEYNNALNHLNIVIKIDKNNKLAHKNKKELISLGVVKRTFKVKNIVIPATGVAVIAILIASAMSINKLYVSNVNKDKKPQVSTVDKSSLNTESTDKTQNIDNQKQAQKEDKKNIEVFPTEEFTKSIESKDYDKLYNMYSKWKDKELSINQKAIMAKAKELLSGTGLEYFYNKGRQCLSAKDYNNAVGYFTIASSLGESNYLYSHVIYLLAVSYKNIGDVENSIKYYKEYDSKYPNGDYEEAVLYDLVLIYKNIDNYTAKSYANKLNKMYPKSIYNNSIIRGIIDT